LKSAVESASTLEYHGRSYGDPVHVEARVSETAALHPTEVRIRNRQVFVTSREPPAFVYLLRADGSFTRYGVQP